MKEILLIKNGELALKGLNRSTFEDILVKNLRRKLSGILECDITKSQSTIYVVPTEEDPDMDAAVEAVSKVFGIARFSHAVVAPKNMQQIVEVSGKYLKDQLAGDQVRVAAHIVEDLALQGGDDVEQRRGPQVGAAHQTHMEPDPSLQYDNLLLISALA